MGAHNTIDTGIKCPICVNGTIIATTYMASSFDGLTRRFMDKEYKLGDKMEWWPPTHPKYAHWNDSNRKNSPQKKGIPTECCDSNCSHCNASYYVELKFDELHITKVVSHGPLADWPQEYSL